MWKLTKKIAFRKGWFGRLVLYVQERHTVTKETFWRRATWADKRSLNCELVQVVEIVSVWEGKKP